MWTYIFTNLALSIAIIFMCHHLWNYFRDTYTPKKSKDLVSYQTQKYKSMMEEVLANSKPDPPSTENEYISDEDKQRMIQELRELVIGNITQ